MAFKTKLRKNDEVIVIAGASKGKRGQIIKIHPKTERITVKGVNVVTKHKKPNQQNQTGGIETFEAPIAISNVALALTKGKNATGATTKLAYEIKRTGDKVTKTRVTRKTRKAI